jgi:hypothetical protein
MSNTHYTVILNDKHYGPFDCLADAKRYARRCGSVSILETKVLKVLGEEEIDLARWERANPPGSECNPIPVSTSR